MAPPPPVFSNADLAAASLAQEAAHSSVNKSTRKKRAKSFEHWQTFCATRNIVYTLQGYQRSVIVQTMQVYSGLLRAGQLPHQANTGIPRRAGTISGQLSAIGTSLEELVETNHTNPFIDADQRWPTEISSMLRGFARADPPPGRQWPVTLSMLQHLCEMAAPTGWPPNKWRAVQDLCVIAFFYLLRPGEFTKSQAELGQPFTLGHIQFHLADQRLVEAHQLHPLHDTTTAVGPLAATVDFVDQKNSHKGDKLTHRATSHPCLCPVKALYRRCSDLNKHFANMATLYHLYFHDVKGLTPIVPADITTAIQLAATAVRPLTGLDPALITASSFRPGGATALLCGGIDRDTIQFIGRWNSDAVDDYLRTIATNLTSRYSKVMLEHGDFSFLAQNDASLQAQLHGLPDQTPGPLLTKYFDKLLADFAASLTVQLKALVTPPP